MRYIKYATGLFAILFVVFFISVLYQKQTTENNDNLHPNDSQTKIAIITDIDHCQTRKPIPEASLMRFVNFANEIKADVTVSLGDNISHRLRKCSDTASEDLPYLVNILNRAPGMSYVLGDHDIASSTDSYRFWLSQIDKERTYYAIDTAQAKLLIVDTVLGGEAMQPSCQQMPECAEALAKYKLLKNKRADLPENSPEYLRLKKQGKVYKKIVEKYKEDTEYTRSAGKRDTGRIDEAQLSWMRTQLENANQNTVVLLSDHPLIPYARASGKKSYNIVNGDKLRELLEEFAQKGKRIISVNGETHEWFKRERNGVTYYGIAEFSLDNGSWALLKITDDKAEVIKYPSQEIL